MEWLWHKADEFERYFIAHRLLTIDVEATLDLFEALYHLTRKAEWGNIPLSCRCKTNHCYAMCKHSALFTSVFDSEIQVPLEYATTPGMHKKCHKVKGTAWQNLASEAGSFDDRDRAG